MAMRETMCNVPFLIYVMGPTLHRCSIKEGGHLLLPGFLIAFRYPLLTKSLLPFFIGIFSNCCCSPDTGRSRRSFSSGVDVTTSAVGLGYGVSVVSSVGLGCGVSVVSSGGLGCGVSVVSSGVLDGSNEVFAMEQALTQCSMRTSRRANSIAIV
jgi:hypothetical protein